MKLRFDNPVLTKEMRTRMRGARAFWVLFGYVMLLSLILFGVYLVWYQTHLFGNRPLHAGRPPLGRQLFQALFITQAVLITLITPALTAGMLTIEREQRTFELLVLTRLRPREIVGGKLLSAFGFVLLLLTSSLPLAGITLMLGGISLWEVAVLYLLLASSAFLYASLGIMYSSLLRGTAVATVATYLTVLMLAQMTASLSAGGSELLFSAVSPITALFNAFETGPFFRWRLSPTFPALAINILGGLLAAAGAVHRLETGFSERPGPLRWLTFLLFIVMGVCITGNVLGASPNATNLRVLIASLAGALLAALAPLSLIFCTGDTSEVMGVAATRLEPAPTTRLGRLLSARLFTGGYAWAPAYLLLLLVTGAILIGGGALLSQPAASLAALDALIGSLLVVAAGTLCCTTLARFCSVLFGGRARAGAVAFSVTSLAMVVPLMGLIGWHASQPSVHRLFWETLYLNPGIALFALGSEPQAWSASMPPLWAGQQGVWLVTVVLYVGLAAVLERWGRRLIAERKRFRKVR